MPRQFNKYEDSRSASANTDEGRLEVRDLSRELEMSTVFENKDYIQRLETENSQLRQRMEEMMSES